MKKISLITCAVAAALCSNTALAADVEIYGRADFNFGVDNYHGGTKDGETNWGLNDGASRFGFNIREQLNEDVSINGYFENGFMIDSGEFMQDGVLFNRRSILSVKSKTYGELAFGRMGTVTSSNAPFGMGITMLDPFLTSYTSDFTISGLFASDSRADNSILYYTPRIGGWQLGLTYSLQRSGEEEEQEDLNDRVASGLISYTNGRFYGVLGASTIMWGNEGSNVDRKDSVEAFAGFNYDLTDTIKVYLGAQYVKDWRLFGYWKPKNHSATSTADEHGVDGMLYITGFRYKASGNTTLIGSYGFFDGEQDVGNETREGQRHRLSVGAEYYLSKRTNLYLVANYTKNEDYVVDNDGYRYKYSALAGMTHKF